jgi:hypothetical protein
LTLLKCQRGKAVSPFLIRFTTALTPVHPSPTSPLASTVRLCLCVCDCVCVCMRLFVCVCV